MMRAICAFLIAPLAVPILLFPFVQTLMQTPRWIGVALVIIIFTSYGGVAIFGVPAYLFLRARGLMAFWIAPSLGFSVGAAMWLVFSAIFALMLDQGVTGIWNAFTDPKMLRGIVWPGGVSGAVVGTIFWLIARPDRSTRLIANK